MTSAPAPQTTAPTGLTSPVPQRRSSSIGINTNDEQTPQRLVVSTPKPGSTHTSNRALPLNRDPQPVWAKHIARDVEQVAAPIREAIRRCAKGESPWPLVLIGPAGTGKTCAVLSLLDRVSGQTFYRNEPDACAELIEAAAGRLNLGGPYDVTVTGWWRRWGDAQLSVLDDIGLREVTNHRYETLKRCLDYRAGKPTVYASNLTLAQIDRLYDDRIASRLSEGTVVIVGGTDRRVAKGRRA